ncbi:MAG: DUF362 domain-containing protein [Candidatus Omnitrophica bacterium]|nr:DUF362 domain-containing protein [Candidatus Omnitrophota bacterium]
MKSEVYFSEIKKSDPESRQSALKKLIEETNPFSGYGEGELIPVKLTIGENKCVYNIRPEAVKVIIAELKKRNTRPFIFDTNVIYTGSRRNAVDHLGLAANKGFGQSKLGAPFIVADGLLGQDGKYHELNAPNVTRIKAPSFIGMLDSLVVLSHITGHIAAGYAGAIKNVAMGMVCRPTKQVQHSSLKPRIKEGECASCGCCLEVCPAGAIAWKDGKAFIAEEICIGCGECLCACKTSAVTVNWVEETPVFLKRMVEVAEFILSKFKNKFFINFAIDVTKECDCISDKNDTIISEDLGILASRDIVSLDKATSDLLNKKEDVFAKYQGRPEYHAMLEYAARRGLGSLDYSLKKI